jgi:serine/threonine protein kinase
MSSHHTGSPSARGRRRFRDTAIASGLLAAPDLDHAEEIARERLGAAATSDAVIDAATGDVLVEQEKLTRFQVEQLLLGRSKLTLGQYVIVDQLGQGGMGQVFKAKHRMMGRFVAVKVLPRAKSTPETEAAFRREIEVLGQLDHENLVRALDAGYDGKVHFLVTEIVPGLDLRRQITRHGVLDEVMAASVIAQAARGLAYAHAAGVVHRDVKPGNILVREDGRVKVSDLGLAGSLLEQGDDFNAKRVIGTIDYTAPEQIRHPDRVNPSADIYSLGCTLYFAVAGRVPFPGGTRQEKAKRHLSDEPTPVRAVAPQITAQFEQVIAEMMEKDPRRRAPSADAVVELLRPWTPAEPVAMLRPAGRKTARAAGRPVSREAATTTGSDFEGGRGGPTQEFGEGAVDDLVEEGRSHGESSFGTSQSTPAWQQAAQETELATLETLEGLMPPPAPTSGLVAESLRRSLAMVLAMVGRNAEKIGRVLSRSAVVGFLFGLAVSLLQAMFGESWDKLGLGFLDFWSAATAVFFGMAVVLSLAATLGGDGASKT